MWLILPMHAGIHLSRLKGVVRSTRSFYRSGPPDVYPDLCGYAHYRSSSGQYRCTDASFIGVVSGNTYSLLLKPPQLSGKGNFSYHFPCKYRVYLDRCNACETITKTLHSDIYKIYNSLKRRQWTMPGYDSEAAVKPLTLKGQTSYSMENSQTTDFSCNKKAMDNH